MRKILLIAAAPVVAAVAVGAALTVALSGTESTTRLDEYSTRTVQGQKALMKNIVEGRTLSKYHPLPWVRMKITDMACPSDLVAVAGTTMTCSAAGGGKSIPVRVSVVKADAGRVTWKFEG